MLSQGGQCFFINRFGLPTESLPRGYCAHCSYYCFCYLQTRITVTCSSLCKQFGNFNWYKMQWLEKNAYRAGEETMQQPLLEHLHQLLVSFQATFKVLNDFEPQSLTWLRSKNSKGSPLPLLHLPWSMTEFFVVTSDAGVRLTTGLQKQFTGL